MEEHRTMSMNLAELVEILVEAGKVPRNKQVKISISSPEGLSSYGQYISLPLREVIQFELFERKIPIDDFRVRDKKSFFNPTPSKY